MFQDLKSTRGQNQIGLEMHAFENVNSPGFAPPKLIGTHFAGGL